MLLNQLDMNTFEQALISNMRSFDIELSPETVTQLGEFYSLLTHWNQRLHLVAPCSPEEFATRHVLESLTLLPHLPQNAKIADVGSGGGLPIIPCLIGRPDLAATLIESSKKKAVFLREALNRLNLRGEVVAQRFEDVAAPQVSVVTCRALEQFTRKIPDLIEWAPRGSTLLLFGGKTLGEQLKKANAEFQQLLIPRSEERFLYLAAHCTDFIHG